MPIDFKNEDEIKEYIENLGIEYRFGCFSEKKPEVCHLLGDYLEVFHKDFTKAAKIYKTNCDVENFPRSCHKYGVYLLAGQGVEKKNIADACNYFAKACSLGVAASCFNAGIVSIKSLRNSDQEKDYSKALEFLEKGCNMENANSCHYLSSIYITGLKEKDKTVLKDMVQAFKFAEKACNLNHLHGCMNLHLMYKKGQGVEKNEEMAQKILLKVEDIKQQMESPISLDFQRGT